MPIIRAGVVGAGLRSAAYLSSIPPEYSESVRLVAVADPVARQREAFVQHLSHGFSTRLYETAEQLLNEVELDALVIGSPNYTHVEIALQAFRYGIPILLEKPVATTIEDCRRLWQGYVAAGRPPVIVGFVLRYTPFYRRVSELLEAGSLGQILSLDADENIVAGITAAFHLDWRRYDQFTGGFFVEKCCHDLDILHWLVGSKVMRVFSTARRSHLISRPPEQRLPRLDPALQKNLRLDYGDALMRERFSRAGTESVYDVQCDVPDHQAALLEFENDVLTTFTACHIQPRSTRRLRVFGADGALEGDIERGRIVVDRPSQDGTTYNTEEINISHDPLDGHHGGDSVIKHALWGAALGHKVEIRAGLREGLEAVITGLGVEESKKCGQPVEIQPLREYVFGAG